MANFVAFLLLCAVFYFILRRAYHDSANSRSMNRVEYRKKSSIVLKDKGFTVTTNYYRGGFLLMYKRTQILIGTPGALPNILFDSTNRAASNYPEQHIDVKKYRKHSLEGDMDNYFTVYTPEDMKLESLQLMTPDVLIFLRDEFNMYDIYIVSGTIDMRRNGHDNSITEKKLTYLIRKIERFYKYWNTQEKIDSNLQRLETH